MYAGEAGSACRQCTEARAAWRRDPFLGEGRKGAAKAIAIIWQVEMIISELQQPPSGGRGGGREGFKFLGTCAAINWVT